MTSPLTGECVIRYHEQIYFIKGNYISIRHFDNWIHMLMGHPPESCGMSGICGCYFVVEADADVYPCDFYVTDEYRLGNIKNQDFKSLSKHPTTGNFIKQSKTAFAECKDCKHYYLCRGGCRRYRTEDGAYNYYCDTFYEFFDYAVNRMNKVANYIMSLQKHIH